MASRDSPLDRVSQWYMCACVCVCVCVYTGDYIMLATTHALKDLHSKCIRVNGASQPHHTQLFRGPRVCVCVCVCVCVWSMEYV